MKVRKKLLLNDVDTLPPNEEIWDGELRGFGARRQNSDAVTYQVVLRTKEGKQRRVKIGRHGVLTLTQARAEAKSILADAAKGLDPAAERKRQRNLPTVADLCNQYFVDAEARTRDGMAGAKKLSTLVTDRSRIERHIRPLMGKLAVATVTRADIEKFLRDVAGGKSKAEKSKRGGPNVTGGKGAASRTLGLLGAIIAHGVKAGMRPDNPVHGVERYKYERRERRLSDAEFAALGRGLKLAAEAHVWPPQSPLHIFWR
jgi:hypothetical protein